MIDDLFSENKYPSEELFCETARQVLTQRQPERNKWCNLANGMHFSDLQLAQRYVRIILIGSSYKNEFSNFGNYLFLIFSLKKKCQNTVVIKLRKLKPL